LKNIINFLGIDMDIKKASEIALMAGGILLSNGAEAYRTQDTVNRILRSYGYAGECMVVADGIILVIEDEVNGEKITSMKKVNKKQVDLYRIELINSFSRSLMKEKPGYDEAVGRLKEIKNAPEFSLFVRLSAACLSGFVYALFFGGSVIDAFAAIPVCFVTYLVKVKISEFGFFQFFENFVSGVIIGLGTYLLSIVFGAVNMDSVITGGVMILIPGVVLTNGMKDIIYGDFTSGIARFFEALLVIAAISIGVGAVLLIATKGAVVSVA